MEPKSIDSIQNINTYSKKNLHDYFQPNRIGCSGVWAYFYNFDDTIAK